MAFETESGAVTVPGGTTQFGDPDETPMPPPLPSARLDEDGSTPDTSSGFSFQMAPTGQSNDNPADNKALIPVP
jgi:hypothetical protein